MPVDTQQLVSNILLLLSALSIAFICILMMYYGVTGVIKYYSPEEGVSLAQWVYNVSGYMLFVLIPLMIATIIFGYMFGSDVLNWAFVALFILVSVDIIIATVSYLLT